MRPLVAIFGATASGKTALSLALAQRFGGEILSCDSVAVYRHMQVGTAKPSAAERLLIPHHLLDLYELNEASTAGEYARRAREILAELAVRETLPILAGGTGLYARALLDGLFPSPPPDPSLRKLLQARASSRSAGSLHRTLGRFDTTAAGLIHPNDTPKLIRAIEVSLAVRRPMTEQWQAGRNALEGYRILRLVLAPERLELYGRINVRATKMFADGLVEETRDLIERFGPGGRPLSSLGYAEASAVLRGEMTEAAAILHAQQGHRNYAKRQTTWFRRECELHPCHVLRGPGDAADVIGEAAELVAEHLVGAPCLDSETWE